MKAPANPVVPTSNFYEHLPAAKNKASVIDILCCHARDSAGRGLREETGASVLVAKTIGTASEQCFACRSLEEDRHVAQSLVDNFPHDLLVGNGVKIDRTPIKTLTTENPDESNGSKLRYSFFSTYQTNAKNISFWCD